MDWQGLFFSGTGFNSASHCASPPPAPSLPPFPCEEHGMVGFSLPNILSPPSPTTAPRPLLVPQDIPALLSYRWPSCLLLRFDCKSTRGCGEGGTETRGEEYTSRCFQGVQALWCLNFWSSPFPRIWTTGGTNSPLLGYFCTQGSYTDPSQQDTRWDLHGHHEASSSTTRDGPQASEHHTGPGSDLQAAQLMGHNKNGIFKSIF